MGDTIKSWTIKILGTLATITLLILVFIGPHDAAEFVGWVKGIGTDAINSGKIFIQELKKQ